MSGQIRALVVEPGMEPTEMQIENTLKALQTLVGGYIECVSFALPDGTELVAVHSEGARSATKGRRLPRPVGEEGGRKASENRNLQAAGEAKLRVRTVGEQTGGLPTCTPAPQNARAGAEAPEGARSATKGEQTGGLPTCTPAPQNARAGAENEEGRLAGKEYNCRVNGVSFVGTVVLLGVEPGEDGDEFADVPPAARGCIQ
ncbi:MAG: DUF3846 domain-containing protein [Clostridia bacterium]|nr:DUF3846 domain-containing protein [Clostridia bacterium]